MAAYLAHCFDYGRSVGREEPKSKADRTMHLSNVARHRHRSGLGRRYDGPQKRQAGGRACVVPEVQGSYVGVT